jgi:3-dehydroquinate synthase
MTSDLTTVSVDLGTRSYPIWIGSGLLARSGELLGDRLVRGRTVVVTDETVASLYLEHLQGSLGMPSETIILPAGEATKSFAHLEWLCEQLLEAGVERKDCILALGGGVIGDLTGFAASILRRGCGFAQVPTTLLAQVDSSIGGKTAINATAGKNLIGAFHQPVAVLIDTETLDTLSDRELRAGYAEVVKYGLIDDPAFFGWCETHAQALLAGDSEARSQAIEISCLAKARIVGLDERETSGTRVLLNLGHTFGHALEAEAGFSDQLLHGEAVALGLLLAFDVSVLLGLCPQADAQRLRIHLKSLGFATTLSECGMAHRGARMIAHMAQDKKMDGGRLPFLLARGIGQTFLATDVDLNIVRDFLDQAT